jgi:hypothetical protein
VVGTEVKAIFDTAAAETVIAFEVAGVSPVLEAVTVREPAVFKVTAKTLVPEERVDAAGRVADGSLEVIETEPAKAVAVLLKASFAITVALNDVPAVADPGTRVNASWVADPALTVSVAVAEVSPVAAAVMVRDPAVFKVKEREI